MGKTGMEDDETRHFLVGLARGLAGALLFALPMLMTMEMWSLGLYVGRGRLLLLCVLALPLLVVLARLIGFENVSCWSAAVRDALIAYALGILIGAAALLLFGILDDQPTTDTIVAKVALQSAPAGIGALLGRSQLGRHSEARDGPDGDEDGETGYAHELFMMVTGALFFSLNVAPTEEMILIAYKITPFHTLLAVLVSIALMHGFVYALHFRGSHRPAEGRAWWDPFLRFTLPGYAIAFAVSLYALWTFGRLDHTGFAPAVTAAVVLALPAAVGAASARLVL